MDQIGVDLGFYLSLVEWPGQNLRDDKPGDIPLGLKPVLERFDADRNLLLGGASRGGGEG